MSMTGKCLCGAVKFTAEKVETHHGACHCGMCRRWSGGPGLGVVAGEVAFEGEENIKTYQSSDWAERAFCQNCGTNLFYRLKETGMTILWRGTFDDQSALTLVQEIFTDEKPQGYGYFEGDHPRLTTAEYMEKLGLSDAVG